MKDGAQRAGEEAQVSNMAVYAPPARRTTIESTIIGRHGSCAAFPVPQQRIGIRHRNKIENWEATHVELLVIRIRSLRRFCRLHSAG